jgi:hypothetical protein
VRISSELLDGAPILRAALGLQFRAHRREIEGLIAERQILQLLAIVIMIMRVVLVRIFAVHGDIVIAHTVR